MEFNLMAHWLFKSEAETWSWDQQKAAGKKGQEWDGVRNYQARNNMRLMTVGDRGFFYHSGKERRIVGIVEVAKAVHPDSTSDDPAWECVDIRAIEGLPKPVTLTDAKANPKLAKMALVANSRLSVQAVTDDEWAEVLRMGGVKG